MAQKTEAKKTLRRPSSKKALPKNGTATKVDFEGDFKITAAKPRDFKKEELIEVYRRMLTARRLDEKMLNLIKQGNGFFHIGTSGHEAAQTAVGMLMKPGYDWASVYYRDLMFVMTLGMTRREIMLHHMAKADDVNSGGRQMAEHYGSKDLNIISMSSSVGSQFLAAVGVGMGIQRRGEDAVVYCSCGDGATSQGAFHEALNWAARDKAPVLFFVQDNGYAISVPRAEQTAGGSIFNLFQGYDGLKRIKVDGTDFFKIYAAAKEAIEHIRSGKGPVALVAEVVRLLPHSSSDNDTKYRTLEDREADKKNDPILSLEQKLIKSRILTKKRVEEIRKEIVQVVDEDTVWANEQADPDPSTVEKYVYYEGDLGLEYESSTPDGEPVVLIDAINHALHEEMERNDKMLVYGEDVGGGKGGVFTVTRDLTTKFGKDRCFNSQLAENSIIGTAVGLASMGYKPVVEIQFGDYIWPAMQNLRNMVATYRYRSNNMWSCPMVVRVPIGGYIHGGLCHSQNIEATFAHIPGLKIVMPSNAADAKGLLKTAIRMEDPILFLEHKFLYRQASARRPEPNADYLIEFGKAAITREGTDLTVVTYGAMVHKAMSAAKVLEKEGVSIEVIDLRSIVPMDMETVIKSVKKTNRALVLYEDYEFMGLGAEISAQIGDQAFMHLDAPVRRLAGKAFVPIPFADALERATLLQDEDVLAGFREILAY